VKFSTEIQAQIRTSFVKGLEQYFAEQTEVTVMDIETTLRSLLIELGAQCLGDYLSHQEAHYPATQIACACGGQAEYQFGRVAKVKSVFDWASYRRAYYVCPACHQGQAPLDQRFGLEPGQVTAGLADLLGVAGVQTSFEEGRQLVERFLLVEVSENTLRKETQGFGHAQAAQEAAWETTSQTPAWLQERLRTVSVRPKRLYGSLDGAHVPLETEWCELKTGCWYEVDTRPTTQVPGAQRRRVGDLGVLRAKNIRYYCDLDQAQAFGELMWATGCQQHADLADELVFVADGAAWIWKLVEHYYPKAVQIVDGYHAESYLEPIAKLAFPNDPSATQAWLENVCTDLWEGGIARVIAACQKLTAHPHAGETAQKAVTYYTNNQARLDYARFRAAGYLIGSGTVESGCKQIVTQRLKRSGARWTKAGARDTAKARAAWLSGTWDALVAQRRKISLAQLPLAV
jgi:hypothetical protein